MLLAVLTWYNVSLSSPCKSVKSASETMKWSFCFMVHTLPAQGCSMLSILPCFQCQKLQKEDVSATEGGALQLHSYTLTTALPFACTWT